MSAPLRRIGIFVYLLATIGLFGIGHQDLFWICLILALIYFLLCGHVQKHLMLAAKIRHEQIRDKAITQGMSQEELQRFNQLPPRITAQDYKMVPVKLAYLTQILFIAGILLFCAALLFRLFL
jgi:hypothetical protein